MPTTNITDTRPASDKQVALIRKLASERPTWSDHLNGADYERCFDTVTPSGKFVGIREASKVIDALFQVPQGRTPVSVPSGVPGDDGTPPLTPPRPSTTKAEPGIYATPSGDIVKVQWNKAKTNVYALRWVEIHGERLVDATEERVHGEWEYSPGLVFGIDPAWRMTLAQAKAFILRYGQCVRCGRHLKAAESVEQGIGPVCRKAFTW
jgi:hypothetical protein